MITRPPNQTNIESIAMAPPSLTQKRLKELLYYNPQFGIFVWIKNKGPRAPVGSMPGTLHHAGYLRIKIDGHLYASHRLAFLYMEGRFPPLFVDHINGRKADNSFNNLRHATKSENRRNSKRPITNTSGAMGVHFASDSKKWKARIKVNGKTINLGSFYDFFEAICARKSGELKHGFHPNHGRAV